MKYSDDNEGFGSFSLETIDTAQSERVGSSRIIDLRRCPRVDTCFQALISSEYGKVDGFVTNLSRSGLRFEAGSELSELLMTGSGQQDGDSSKIVEIYFDVPMNDAVDRSVIVQARAVYVISDDDGSYSCGVEFKVFAEGEQALEDYLHARDVGK